jgi:hypothetical protein
LTEHWGEAVNQYKKQPSTNRIGFILQIRSGVMHPQLRSNIRRNLSPEDQIKRE